MKVNFCRGFFDWRVWALLIPASAVLALDMPVLLTLLYSLSAMFLIVAVAHVIRRVMFPYLNLEEVENRASETPFGAGLVFLGTSLLVSAVIIGSAVWVSR